MIKITFPNIFRYSDSFRKKNPLGNFYLCFGEKNCFFHSMRTAKEYATSCSKVVTGVLIDLHRIYTQQTILYREIWPYLFESTHTSTPLNEYRVKLYRINKEIIESFETIAGNRTYIGDHQKFNQLQQIINLQLHFGTELSERFKYKSMRYQSSCILKMNSQLKNNLDIIMEVRNNIGPKEIKKYL